MKMEENVEKIVLQLETVMISNDNVKMNIKKKYPLHLVNM